MLLQTGPSFTVSEIIVKAHKGGMPLTSRHTAGERCVRRRQELKCLQQSRSQESGDTSVATTGKNQNCLNVYISESDLEIQ